MPKSQKQPNAVLKPLIIVIITVILLVIFILFALLFAPQEEEHKESIPIFTIAERDWITKEQWEVNHTIAVFDETIHPGSSGEYQFILRNESDVDLWFGIHLFERINTTISAHSFMRYQLTMDDVVVDNNKVEWHRAEEIKYQGIRLLPGADHLFSLKWEWPFENGNDEEDTLIGVAGGTVSISFIVFAEVAA